MSHYAGIDVSVEASHVCVIDGNGKIAGGEGCARARGADGWFGSVGFATDADRA